MMDAAEWSDLWGELEGRFGTERPGDTGALYLELLERRLEDDEIRLAVRRSVYADRFFPSPAELVAHAQQEDPARPYEDWRVVVEAANAQRTLARGVTSGTRKEREAHEALDAFRSLPAPALKAASILGGLIVIGAADGDGVSYLRSEFLRVREAYRQGDVQRALPSAKEVEERRLGSRPEGLQRLRVQAGPGAGD
jgi:hypothetical protein